MSKNSAKATSQSSAQAIEYLTTKPTTFAIEEKGCGNFNEKNLHLEFSAH